MRVNSVMAPVDTKPARHGLQIVNPPVTRVVSHPFEGFFVAGHATNGVAWGNIYQAAAGKSVPDSRRDSPADEQSLHGRVVFRDSLPPMPGTGDLARVGAFFAEQGA